MANQEQLRILKDEGVEAWNEWRKNNPDIEIDLSEANLSNADLRYADLSGANFSDAHLGDAYLYRANLKGVNLYRANLYRANLYRANLQDANLRDANLKDANLYRANLQDSILQGAYFKGAILQGTILQGAIITDQNFSESNFNGKDLRKADLTNTNLARLQALGTNFEGAIFTGACIEDWHINSKTNLENVICEYIYLNEGRKERRPSDPNRNFEPGEFVKLVEKSTETVDLIFNEGIDWKAFLSSYQDIQVEYGDQNVSIQAIEKKSDDAFVIRLSVPPEADKADIESKVKQSYETKLKVLEAQYRAELKGLEAHHKDEIISLRKEHNTQILELAKLAASRPITVEAKAVAENQSKNVEVEMNISGGNNTGVAGKVAGDQNVYASEQKQTLAEAAAEIQKLLQQLEQTNPTATVEQKKAYVDAAISPTLKQRFVGALTSGGETAIEEFLDNPYIKVGKAIVKGWIKPD